MRKFLFLRIQGPDHDLSIRYIFVRLKKSHHSRNSCEPHVEITQDGRQNNVVCNLRCFYTKVQRGRKITLHYLHDIIT